MQHNIKYQYAKDSNGNVINVFNLENTPEIRDKSYTCFSCNKSVIPVLGKVRQKHFRHLEAAECNGETYLHNLSKQLFFQVYKECLFTNSPFYIELNKPVKCIKCEKDLEVSCNLTDRFEKYSLTDYFSEIYLETHCDGFVPDVLLKNKNGEKIFIEFAVTHNATEEKIHCQNRIIEISIFDEESLTPILSRNLSQRSEQFKFYNFNPTEMVIEANPNCDKSFRFLF